MHLIALLCQIFESLAVVHDCREDATILCESGRINLCVTVKPCDEVAREVWGIIAQVETLN